MYVIIAELCCYYATFAEDTHARIIDMHTERPSYAKPSTQQTTRSQSNGRVFRASPASGGPIEVKPKRAFKLAVVPRVFSMLSGLVMASYSIYKSQQKFTESTMTTSDIMLRLADSDREFELGLIQSHFVRYGTANNTYPTLAEANDPTWRQTYIPYIQDSSMSDTDSKTSQFANKTTKGQYAYIPTGPNGEPCDAVETQCAHFSLTAVKSNGTTYTLTEKTIPQ